MTTGRTVESEEEISFLKAIAKVFQQYPEVAEKYAVHSLALEVQMGIDFERQFGISRVEGDRIITEFVDRAEPIRRSAARSEAGIPPRICLEQDESGFCLDWWYY
ncbi:hypothetical protein AB0E74_27795 [Streptomyces sp. NPDC030392]|uniref:hypothetical protein n=1 Tax=Streptomyces sp. NPDC030392 TaxID=3155468 RepID=UPI0033EB51DF